MISVDNKIFTAAILAEPHDAAQLLQRALGIEDEIAATLDMPTRGEWMRMRTGMRLQHLAKWMHGAAFALVDLAEIPVEALLPMETVGTND